MSALRGYSALINNILYFTNVLAFVFEECYTLSGLFFGSGYFLFRFFFGKVVFVIQPSLPLIEK